MYLKLVSTKNANIKSTIKKAILNPSINNNGLWSFLKINKMSKNYFNELPNKDFNEIALDISKNFGLDNEIEEEKLKKIIDKSFNFPIINRKISTNLSMCELYHGPSKSFKDIGTIFTANLIE
jgi:threonine synthase